MNFWNDQAAGLAGLGTWISVSSSPGSSAVSKMPLKNSAAGTARVPDAPRITNVASSASSTAGRSEAASPCATEPPIVPRCRICGSPTCPAAWASSGISAASSADVVTSWCLVSAPTAT